jgi:hypothetical protein
VVPACRPRHGTPFAPGLGGPIPPLRRYYEVLRLPPVPLAALRCLAWRYHPCVLFAPSDPTQGRGPGSWYSGSRAGNVSGDGWGSQVPEQPSCPCALSLDPGRTRHAWPLRRADVAPACVYNGGSRDEYFGAREHGIKTRCLRFAVRVTPPHARLASGCWPSSAGRDSLTRRVAMKGFCVRVTSSFLELVLSQRHPSVTEGNGRSIASRTSLPSRPCWSVPI